MSKPRLYFEHDVEIETFIEPSYAGVVALNEFCQRNWQRSVHTIGCSPEDFPFFMAMRVLEVPEGRYGELQAQYIMRSTVHTIRSEDSLERGEWYGMSSYTKVWMNYVERSDTEDGEDG